MLPSGETDSTATGQTGRRTDGRTLDGYITLSAKCGQHNKSCDSVDKLENLRLRRMLRPALQRRQNQYYEFA